MRNFVRKHWILHKAPWVLWLLTWGSSESCWHSQPSSWHLWLFRAHHWLPPASVLGAAHTMVQGPLSTSDSKNPSYNCIQLLWTRLSFQTGNSKNERVKPWGNCSEARRSNEWNSLHFVKSSQHWSDCHLNTTYIKGFFLQGGGRGPKEDVTCMSKSIFYIQP